MKIATVAAAAMAFLLFSTSSAKSNTISNDETSDITDRMNDAAMSCGDMGDPMGCEIDLHNAGEDIEEAVERNTELIQIENTRIDALEAAGGGGGGAITSLSDSNGKNIIRKDASGAIHIGENSLVTIEEGGRQKMYATNAAGESIDIDITNGSKLLINGRDVEKSIDNVGALSAALSSVPAVSADSQFTCGLGGGTHSSAYAISGGCASKVSDRVSVNAAIATVINNGNGDSNDNISARAGFTFKLGKIDDSPKVVARKAAALHDEVATLRDENAAIRDENASIKAASIEQQQLNLALMARLERLEAVALGQNPAITTASLK